MPNRRRDELSPQQQIEFDRNAEYLANVVASGLTDWQPSKSLGEYSYEELRRKAGKFHRMQDAGLPLWNSDARGHRNKEGKSIPIPPGGVDRNAYATPRQPQPQGTRPAATPTPRQAQRQRAEPPTPLTLLTQKLTRFKNTATQIVGNYVESRTEDVAKLQKMIERVSKIDPNMKVFPQWKDTDGNWHSAFQHGIKAESLLKMIMDKKADMKSKKQRGNPLAALIEEWTRNSKSPFYEEETDDGVPEYIIVLMPEYLQTREHLPLPQAV